MPRVRCSAEDCKHWKDDAGCYVGEGGCTLEEITIGNNTMMACGFPTICEDYEEK